MKNSVTIALFAVLVAVYAGYLVLPKTRVEMVHLDMMKDQPRGSISIISYEPPVELMPALNRPPDAEKCPDGSPVHCLWLSTQTRSITDALDFYVEEARETILDLDKSPILSQRPYFTSNEAQLAAARKAMKCKILGMLVYRTLNGELVAIVVTKGENKPALYSFVDRGKGWRFIMNQRTQGGLDLDLVVKSVWREMGKRQVARMPNKEFVVPLVKAAVRKARIVESKDWKEIQQAEISKAMPIAELRKEGEKCRLFLLKYPKTCLIWKVRSRLDGINVLLINKGGKTMDPYRSFAAYMKLSKKKVKR